MEQISAAAAEQSESLGRTVSWEAPSLRDSGRITNDVKILMIKVIIRVSPTTLCDDIMIMIKIHSHQSGLMYNIFKQKYFLV